MQPIFNEVKCSRGCKNWKLKLGFLLFWYSGKALSEQGILYHHSGLDKLPMSLLLTLHSGSFCQLPKGKPMAAMSTIGYLSSNDIKSSLKALLLQMISTKCFNMQRVKNIRPCLTLLLTQGVNGLVMVRVRRESERFQSLA